MTTPTVIAALIDAANEIERLGGDPSRFHKVAWDARHEGEPVAWRLTADTMRDHAIFVTDKDRAEAANSAGLTVTPLYAAPPAQASALDTFIQDFEQVHGKGDA